MSVGLYDADMMKYINTAPNLELMKIAAYCKNKGEITSMSDFPNSNLYDKIYYRKDYDDDYFAPVLTSDKRIEYGGLSFTNNIYVPLPLEIEKTIPDTSIYNKMSNHLNYKIEMKRGLKPCLNSRHLRLSLDGKTIWKDFEKQIDFSKKQNYFFHDFDLNKIQDSELVIKELVKDVPKNQGYISTKFPIQIFKEEDLKKWLNFKASAFFFNLSYYGLMSDDLFKYFLMETNLQNTRKSIQYVVTHGFKDQQDFVDNGVERMYKQFIFACTHRKEISLIYDDDFFIDDIWKDFFTLLRTFNHFSTTINGNYFKENRYKFCLYNFACNLQNKQTKTRFPITKNKAREIFIYMREKNYNLFKMFYESHLVE